MIIMDTNQIMISNLFEALDKHTNAELDENMLRHMVLNSIRRLNSKFRNEYGQLILCFDSPHSWRKDEFPYYKANRKTKRDKSELDWNMLHSFFDKVVEELKEYSPYKILRIDGAESDDSIGVICHQKGKQLAGMGEKILILSRDGDFKQLLKYGNVRQYDPITDKNIVCQDPEEYLLIHTLKGDTGDGIPNVRSEDNHLILKESRQKPITKKFIQSVKDEGIPEEYRRNFERNKKLIDLSLVPQDLKDVILEEFFEEKKKKNNMLNYMMKYKLKNLTKYLADF